MLLQDLRQVDGAVQLQINALKDPRQVENRNCFGDSLTGRIFFPMRFSSKVLL